MFCHIPSQTNACHHVCTPSLLPGTSDANPLTDALTANKRSTHDYTRSPNFESIVKIYESPNKNDENKNHPKCKVNLNFKLNDNAEPLASSRSSLYSIPSIEWDVKAKSDFAWRTRSLPRQRVSNHNCHTLFRTRSHGGFINAYMKDPEPTHYHLPRCRSCGATNNSYAWELTKEEKEGKVTKASIQTSIYFSVDNIPQKCVDEERHLKVKETIVPVFNVEKVLEFVESQEFTEDNYLGELGNSFSTENQTIIEKPALETEKYDGTVTEDKIEKNTSNYDGNGEIYRAERVNIDTVKKEYVEMVEGEYHSFSDDFEDAYVSPVKDLVEKDIRDYSVPIDFYCDDYLRRNEKSPKKSPHKSRDVAKTVLEPIQEESKSSYGVNSTNLSVNVSKRDSDVQNAAEMAVVDVLEAVKSKVKEQSDTNTEQSENEADVKKDQCKTNDDAKALNTDMQIENQEDKQANTACIVAANNSASNEILQSANKMPEDHRKSSFENSVASSTNELVTLDSTAEFEKYEAISELLIGLLSRIDYDSVNKDFFYKLDRRSEKLQEFHNENVAKVVDVVKKVKVTEQVQANEVSNDKFGVTIVSHDCVPDVPHKDDTDTVPNSESDKEQENKDLSKKQNSTDSFSSSEENNDGNFSITKLVHDFDSVLHLNETLLTETSDSGVTESFKVAESLIYYIFDRALYISNNRNKTKTTKRVITVVDPEDILYTAQSVWLNNDENENFGTEKIKEKNRYDLKDQYEDELLDINTELVYRPIGSNTGIYIEEQSKNIPVLNLSTSSDGNTSQFDQFEDSDTVMTNLDDHIYSNIDYAEVQHDESITNYSEMDNRSKFVIADTTFFKSGGSEDNNDDNSVRNNEEVTNSNISIENFGLFNVFSYLNEGPEGDINNNSQDFEQQVIHDLNNAVDFENAVNNVGDDSSTDDEGSRELSRNNIEIAEDIIDNLFNETADFNILSDDATMIETKTDTTNIDKVYNETFTENEDKMNMAFVHASSSPEKGCKIFESCTESPIRNPSVSFVSQDMTGLYENDDAILGSPFLKRASVISMSQTENSGGLKYWISFDDTTTDHTINRSFNDSVTQRVWRKTRRIDDAIPSFYGVNFENNSESQKQKFRNRSVLIHTEISENLEESKNDVQLEIEKHTDYTDGEVNVNKSLEMQMSAMHKLPDIYEFTSHKSSDMHEFTSHKLSDEQQTLKKLPDMQGTLHKSSDMQEVLHKSPEMQGSLHKSPDMTLSSPVSSQFYKTCESFNLESPQKRFIYKVHRKQRLYSTWPPFEETLFYRIVSKFRMSESFDPSDLDITRIST